MKLLRRRARVLADAVRDKTRPVLRLRPNDGRALTPTERIHEAVRAQRGVTRLHITGADDPALVGRLRRAQENGELP